MKHLYIANWKMNLSFNESINFCENNYDTLEQLSKVAEFVFCPSFVALAPVANIFKTSSLKIGAQDCSEHISGAYTGQVSAQSLAEVGVDYCIVGHSEQRVNNNKTTATIINKINLLYKNNIMPIICIGETHKDFLEQQTLNVLTEQLKPILMAIACLKKTIKRIVIGYEPLWAIGANTIPNQQQLTAVFEHIEQLVQSHLPDYAAELLYGGSVNQNNIPHLKKIPPINGFLIGGASTNIDQLKNIIMTPTFPL